MHKKERKLCSRIYSRKTPGRTNKIDEWEKSNIQESKSIVQNLEVDLTNTETKLDKLVSTYLDGDIEKPIYLKKKEELMKQKMSLETKKKDFGQQGKNRNEPLRCWILYMKTAKNLAVSENYPDIN